MKTKIVIEANTTNYPQFGKFSQWRGQRSVPAARSLRASRQRSGMATRMRSFGRGERYYRRRRIDIIDFYPLDLSRYGGGVEDVNVGIGKMAVAFLNGARADVVSPQNG